MKVGTSLLGASLVARAVMSLSSSRSPLSPWRMVNEQHQLQIQRLRYQGVLSRYLIWLCLVLMGIILLARASIAIDGESQRTLTMKNIEKMNYPACVFGRFAIPQASAQFRSSSALAGASVSSSYWAPVASLSCDAYDSTSTSVRGIINLMNQVIWRSSSWILLQLAGGGRVRHLCCSCLPAMAMKTQGHVKA